MGEGGELELISELEFLFGVAFEVVVAGELDGWGVWGEGLYDDFSF